jgi:hypothetical protein
MTYRTEVLLDDETRSRVVANPALYVHDLISRLDAAQRRLEFLLGECSQITKDAETGECRVRVTWDSGWCIEPRHVIDVAIENVMAGHDDDTDDTNSGQCTHGVGFDEECYDCEWNRLTGDND